MNDLQTAARYMGAKLTDDNYSLFVAARAIAKEVAQPKHLVKAVCFLPVTNGINADGLLLVGHDIKSHLSNCKEGYLIAATLGSQMDEAIRRESLLSVAKGMALSAYASTLIEAHLDTLCQSLMPITERFSPGYGDLPLHTQPAFLQAIGASRIGLYLTDGLMLVPEKSVTAIVGKTANPIKQTHCETCNQVACPYREECK